MVTVSEHFKAHVDELLKRSLEGDSFATKSLVALSLLRQGWRYGDPDPDGDDPDPGEVAEVELGSNVVDLHEFLTVRKAA